MFSADSVEALFRTALDLAAAEFMMQKEDEPLGVGVENGRVILGASQKSALAHYVATLTMSAVKSSFLPDTQYHNHAESPLPTNGGATDVFRDGACFPALLNLQNEYNFFQNNDRNSSFDHTGLCDVPTSMADCPTSMADCCVGTIATQRGQLHRSLIQYPAQYVLDPYPYGLDY